MDLFRRWVHVTFFAGLLLRLYLVSGLRDPDVEMEETRQATHMDTGMKEDRDTHMDIEMNEDRATQMDIEMKEEDPNVQPLPNPVVEDPLYLQLKFRWPFQSQTHIRKEALGQICLRVMQKVHNVYGVKVANLCKRGRCPPEEFGIRLQYKRALLGEKGGFDYLAEGPLKMALSSVTAQMAPFFAQCMDRKIPGSNWRTQPNWSVVSAALARFYGVGNCGEMADLALTEATHWAALLGFSVESLGGVNYDHAWTVFNRDPAATNLWQPAQWNDDAVICDNWLGEAIDPKGVITNINQPRNPNLTPMQRLELIGHSNYLHEIMPSVSVLRTDTAVPHTTRISATSQQLLDQLPGTKAEDVYLWNNPTAECAVETDREVSKYLQQIPQAAPWLRIFHSHQRSV